MRELNSLGYYTIPVTGKPSTYALRILRKSKLQPRGVVAENAGVYIKPNSNLPHVFGTNLAAIWRLKAILGLKQNEKGLTSITLAGKKSQIVVDPEDVSIFTIFTKPEAVSHKWDYKVSMSTDEIFEGLKEIIKKNNLEKKLQLLPAFSDGGIQVIRRDNGGKPIDKARLTDIVKIMYKNGSLLPIAMFGDGHNDLPAMSPQKVIAITFKNAESEVKKFIKKKRGYISPFNAVVGVGIVDGLRWLANNGFFKSDATVVLKKITNYFPQMQTSTSLMNTS